MFLIYCTSVCICYHVAAFVIQFDMQHYNVLKKFNLNLLTPRALGKGGVCGGNICYHVVAFVNMQHDHVLKKLILTPPPGGGRRGTAGKIYATTFPHS